MNDGYQIIWTLPVVTLPPPASTSTCVSSQHFQPPVVLLSSQNNLLCFLIWNPCMLHVFLSAANPCFLAPPSPAPNLFHHACSPIQCAVHFHMTTCCATSPQYYSPLCDNRIVHHITTNSHLFLPFLARAPLSPSLSFSHTLSLPSAHLCWR